MKSLRGRLFVILVASTGAIWLIAAAWIYASAKSEVEGVLDARLQEAARMVSSLVSASSGTPSQFGPSQIHGTELQGYERQLSCQIWSLDGRLVARSTGAPDTSMSDESDGFSERQIDGDTWRVYTIKDEAKGVRVLVGDKLGLREHLVAELIKGLLAPTLLIIPILGFLIWTSLSGGLRPLRVITNELLGRDADDMSPLSAGRAPTEIQPVVVAFNGLFAKVKAARQHEREITAFAAHELRTPLAGLRTQAQIAIAATEPATRLTALRQILVAVDRTARLVRQLLAISKLDSAPGLQQEPNVNLGEALEEVITTLPAPNDNVEIIVDPILSRTALTTNRDLLILALRNLHENATSHMLGAGTIRWSANRDAETLRLVVEDEGPGIPEDEIALVTNRFYRGRHKSPFGSGLGLSIVELALQANNAKLTLRNRTDRSGLRAEIEWRTETHGNGRGNNRVHDENLESHLAARPVGA